MNNYIINPSIFYWMNVLDTSRGMIIFVAIISMATLLIMTVLYFMSTDVEECSKEETKAYKRMMFISGIIMVVSSIIVIFVPDKRTSIEMLIARTATYENTQLTVQGVKEIVDYIVQAINGI